MIAFKLAFKNLFGAGLRTWLNVSVLSFAFVVIVFYNGMLDGWNRQAYRDTEEWSAGKGQIWHPLYDPYDPYSLLDAHGQASGELDALAAKGEITPLLIAQGTIFPQGRMMNVLINGIDPRQQILKIPTASLSGADQEIPAVIGKRMARAAGLKTGDHILLRWRDKNGTFDAKEIQIAGIFSANVPAIDNNQIWLGIENLRGMTGYTNEATLFIVGKDYKSADLGEWQFKDLKFLMKDIDEVLSSKRAGATIIYGLMLIIALLAIFDTQVLSIFRRQKEIGTYIALGMTRWRVIWIFTIEGSAHSILAIALGLVWGTPLLIYLQKTGIPMPQSTDDYGLAIADVIIPSYSFGVILSTIVLVFLSATIVSYFPTRKIARLNPTDALKGKLQ